MNRIIIIFKVKYRDTAEHFFTPKVLQFICHIIVYLKHVKEQNGLTPRTKQKMVDNGILPDKKMKHTTIIINQMNCNQFVVCVCVDLKWQKMSAEKMDFIEIIRFICASSELTYFDGIVVSLVFISSHCMLNEKRMLLFDSDTSARKKWQTMNMVIGYTWQI